MKLTSEENISLELKKKIIKQKMKYIIKSRGIINLRLGIKI